MFRIVRSLIGIISLVTSAIVAYRELHKAWISLKSHNRTNGGQQSFRSSEYATPFGSTGTEGSPYNRYTG